MSSPFKDIDQAFEPMFDEHVVIVCDRGSSGSFRQTVNVIVDEDMDDEPLGDQMTETDIERISVTCKEADWNFLQRIQTGDLIERPEFHGKRYKVFSVARDRLMGIVVKARTFGK